MPAPNHKGQGTSGGFHGDDTESDGDSLTGPQPYSEGDKREFPRYAAGSLRVRVGTSNATLGGNPMVGSLRVHAEEEVNVLRRSPNRPSRGYLAGVGVESRDCLSVPTWG